ncbi:SPX domain-containing protein [Cerioporus squamosus]|nr:SPX domain-containing protein [Cerioporus squamosus]
MKFARYLEETQTPEWKKAYIDYRGLKKRITAIRRAHQAASSSSDEDLSPTSPRDQSAVSEHRNFSAPRPSEDTSSLASGPVDRRQSESSDIPGREHDRGRHAHWQTQDEREELESSPERLEGDGHVDSPTRPTIAARSTTVEHAALPRMRRGRSNTVTTVLGRALQRANSTKGTTSGSLAGPRFDVRRPIPLMELLPQLTPVERAFFDKLDEELDKVESFYCERERDMRHRCAFLHIFRLVHA